jgi:MFS family permease
VLVASALMGATFSAMFTFYQPYALSLGGKSVSPFFVGFTITAVLTRVLIGSLGDRFGHREVSVGAMLAYGAVALATSRLQVGYLWAYGLAFGTAHGILYPTLNTHGVRCSAGARGRVFTVYGGALNVGMVSPRWSSKLAASAGFLPARRRTLAPVRDDVLLRAARNDGVADSCASYRRVHPPEMPRSLRKTRPALKRSSRVLTGRMCLPPSA